jgi:hypothetical protein
MRSLHGLAVIERVSDHRTRCRDRVMILEATPAATSRHAGDPLSRLAISV